MSSVKETLKENLGDLRVDLFAIEEKITRSTLLETVDTNQLRAKCEILATTRRISQTQPLSGNDGEGFDGID